MIEFEMYIKAGDINVNKTQLKPVMNEQSGKSCVLYHILGTLVAFYLINIKLLLLFIL